MQKAVVVVYSIIYYFNRNTSERVAGGQNLDSNIGISTTSSTPEGFFDESCLFFIEFKIFIFG